METRRSNSATPVSTALSATLGATSFGDNHVVWLWTTFDGKIVYRLVGKGQAAFSAAWSRDGSQVAWGFPRKAGDLHPPLQMAFRLAARFRIADANLTSLRSAAVPEEVLKKLQALKETLQRNISSRNLPRCWRTANGSVSRSRS
jgi:hypothetical protein